MKCSAQGGDEHLGDRRWPSVSRVCRVDRVSPLSRTGKHQKGPMNIIPAMLLISATLVACKDQSSSEDAAAGTTATETPVAARLEPSLADRVANFRRPYGDRAPWNIPVAGLPRHPESDRVLGDAVAKHGAPAREFQPELRRLHLPGLLGFRRYAVYRVNTRWPSNLDGSEVPWNPNWRAAPGTDAQVIIIDEKTGREWNLFQVTADNGTVFATRANLVPGDYRTRTTGYEPSRGVGIPYLAMLVRPEEIAAGRIRHALSMPAKNTSGVYSVPPAMKLEHNTGEPGIPEGLRFAIDVTDQEIEDWARSLPGASDETRRSARIIARALRDYGWFITDSAGSSHFQFEANVSAEEDWAQLGLTSRGSGEHVLPRDLFDGLITQDRIYAIVPSNAY